MPKVVQQRRCVYCPDCGKEFKNSSILLQHANQPLGRCRSFGRQSHARVIAIATRLGRRPSPPLESSYPLDPPSSQVPADIDIDSNNITESDSDAPIRSIHAFPHASQNFRGGNTFLGNFDADINAPQRRDNVYYPFADAKDWEMGQWLTLSGLSMLEVDRFLSIRLVRRFLYRYHF